jgi:plasmid stabilization system protein ParE
MQMNTLTDAELRRLIDNEPRNLAAVFEGARRFCEGSSEERRRVEELECEVEVLASDEKMYRDTCDELRLTIGTLNDELAKARRKLEGVKVLVDA